MRIHKRGIGIVLTLFVLSGCVSVPTGPSVMVLPPADKTWGQFQLEDAKCRQWASQQIGTNPQEVANQNTATGAVAGTAIGAGIGAAMGSASGNTASGAAFGAATGLLFGAAAGASSGQYYGSEAQRRYDIAYQQCMYANGNIIPGMRRPVKRILPPPPPPPPNLDYPSSGLYQSSPALPPPPPPAK
jgi:hypothetical protein